MQFTKRPLYDAESSGAKDLGDLPEWDLSDLYATPDAKEFGRDMAWLEKACAEFAKDYDGKLADLDAQGLLECVLRYEHIDGCLGESCPSPVCVIIRTPPMPSAPSSWPMPGPDNRFHDSAGVFHPRTQPAGRRSSDRVVDANEDLARFKPVFDRCGR